MAASASFNQVFIDSEHTFYHDIKVPVTASMLAHSLTGMDGVAKSGIKILNRLLDSNIKDAEILVTSFKAGSLDESLIFRLVMGKGKEGERNLEKLRKDLRLKNMTLPKLITLAVIVAAGYGIYSFLGGKPEAAIRMDNCFNNWGKEVGMKGEELMAAVHAAVPNKEELRKQVVQFAHPDGSKEGGALSFDGSAERTLPKEVMDALPRKYAKDQVDEPVRIFKNVTVVIRALDLDNRDKGWSAVVAEISDRRLPLRLAEGIRTGTIPAGKNTQADVNVVYRVNKHGDLIAKRYELQRLVPADTVAKKP